MMTLQARKWESIVLVIFTLGLVITFISAPLDCLRKREKKSESILIGSSGVGSWTAIISTNAPEGRWEYTTIWTGNEMIIWGGINASSVTLNTGAKYNPSTDTWSPITTTNAPSARIQHTAVWTGSEMIIWGGGGAGVNVNTGAKYNPLADTWTPITTTNAPIARNSHTAVWTGNPAEGRTGEMVIWGGQGGETNYLNDGAKYNPISDTWTTISTLNAPAPRVLHEAIWTDSIAEGGTGEMIIWDGDEGSTADISGGRYNPSSDTWVTITTAGKPLSKYTHSAIWTGTEMIIWGGGNAEFGGLFNTGAKYNPSNDTWVAIAPTNTLSARGNHSAIWTGTEMIIWGGIDISSPYLNDGAKYNPLTDTWIPTTLINAPPGRFNHSAVWTGTEMIIWGGGWTGSNYPNDGAKYKPR